MVNGLPVSAVAVFAGFLLSRDGCQPSRQSAGCFVMLLQLIDAARDVLDMLLQNLLGDLFIIEDDSFFNRA